MTMADFGEKRIDILEARRKELHGITAKRKRTNK
jgi:hypothetical protein